VAQGELFVIADRMYARVGPIQKSCVISRSAC